MIQCPKCGAMNPDGFRNCRECYHPFGMENAVNPPAPPAATPPPGAYSPGAPPPQGAYSPGAPPVGPGQAPAQSVQVLSVRPIRKIHPAWWIAGSVLLVAMIFTLAWFLTHSGSNSYLEEVFTNMEDLSGWEADVRVDSTDFPVDEISFYLGSVWEGELKYQSPDRFSLSATSSEMAGTYSLRVISDELYEWDPFSRQWVDLGPIPDEQKGVNPLWNKTLLDELSIKEEEGTQEIDGTICKVLTFDQEITVTEETYMGDYDFAYRFAGSFYVDASNNLLISLDYIVEMSDYGRSHYQYTFHSHGSQVTVEVPPGVVSPTGGG